MNCKTCNIAAPQYELFDGLCGKCLLAAHQRTLAELEKSQIEHMNLEENLEVSTQEFATELERVQKQAAAMREALLRIDRDFFCDFQELGSERHHDPKQCRNCIALTALASDAGRDYVRKESVGPIVEALRSLVMHLDGFDLNFCFSENDETNQLIEQAKRALKK